MSFSERRYSQDVGIRDVSPERFRRPGCCIGSRHQGPRARAGGTGLTFASFLGSGLRPLLSPACVSSPCRCCLATRLTSSRPRLMRMVPITQRAPRESAQPRSIDSPDKGPLAVAAVPSFIRRPPTCELPGGDCGAAGGLRTSLPRTAATGRWCRGTEAGLPRRQHAPRHSAEHSLSSPAAIPREIERTILTNRLSRPILNSDSIGGH